MDLPSEPLDLVLDVGNSRTKLALFGRAGVVRHGFAANSDLAAIAAFLGTLRPQAIAVGSVAAADPSFLNGLMAMAPVVVVSGETPAPLRSTYASSATLGADRLANAVAAVQRFPGRPVLAIDLGTCITYDSCEANGTYSGGAISPGMRMRAKAMNAYSARLPLVDPAPAPAFVGTTTETSLEAGIHFGILGELEGTIRRYRTDRPDLAVVLTGGDAVRFSRALESGIFALPFLTLEGYHALLVHHRSLHGGTVAAGTAGGSGTRPAG